MGNPEFDLCHGALVSIWRRECFRFTRSTRRARSWWRASSRAISSAMLFWALLVDGWQSLAEKPDDQIIDLAA